MNTSSLNLRYQSNGAAEAARYQVEVFNDGQLVVHTRTEADGKRTHLISAWGGPHALNTLHKLDIQVLRGPVTIAPAGAAKKAFKSSGKMSLKPGAQFTVTAGSFAQLSCTPKPGPGFAHDSIQPSALD
jgi:hypothetical protein